jgi:uncharacterized protein (TIRG00374 family)
MEKHLTWKAIPLFAIGLVIFFLFLYLLGFGKIAASLKSTNLAWYSLAFIAVAVDVLVYSIAWLYLLRSLSVKTSLKEAFLFVWIGSFVDILVPAESISGEVTKAYLMAKSSGGDTGKIVASVVSHKILNITITLTGLIIGSVLFIVKHPVGISGLILFTLLLVTVGTAILVIFLIILCIKESITERITDWGLRFITFVSRGRWQLTSLRLRTKKMLKAFHKGIQILGKTPKALVLPVVFTTAAWAFSFFIPFLVFVSLGNLVDISVIIIVYSISFAIRAIPIGVPGDVGLTESIVTYFYILLGLSPGISAAATILTAISTIGFKLLVGYIAIHWIGIKILTNNKN